MSFYRLQSKFGEGNVFTAEGVGTSHASWDRSHGRVLPPRHGTWDTPPQEMGPGIPTHLDMV